MAWSVLAILWSQPIEQQTEVTLSLHSWRGLKKEVYFILGVQARIIPEEKKIAYIKLGQIALCNGTYTLLYNVVK